MYLGRFSAILGTARRCQEECQLIFQLKWDMESFVLQEERCRRYNLVCIPQEKCKFFTQKQTNAPPSMTRPRFSHISALQLNSTNALTEFAMAVQTDSSSVILSF